MFVSAYRNTYSAKGEKNSASEVIMTNKHTPFAYRDGRIPYSWTQGISSQFVMSLSWALYKFTGKQIKV